MTTILRTKNILLILTIISLFIPYVQGQNAYFEKSTYIDNGNPTNFLSNDYQVHSDPLNNRIYYFGKILVSSGTNTGTPNNYLTTNGTNVNANLLGYYAFLMVTDTTGSLSYSTLLHFGEGNVLDLHLYSSNNDVYLYGRTYASDLTTTNNSSPTSSGSYISKGFIVKYSNNTITNNGILPDYASYIGDSINTEVSFLQHDGNSLWALCKTNDSTLPTTQSTAGPSGPSCYLIGITNTMMANNSSLNSTPFAKYFKSSGYVPTPKALLTRNGNLYALIRQMGGDFYPLTENTAANSETILLKISNATLYNNLPFTATNGNYSSYLPLKVSINSKHNKLISPTSNQIAICGIPYGTALPLTATQFPFEAQGLTVASISDITMDNNLALFQNNYDYLAQTGIPIQYSSFCFYTFFNGNLYIYSRAGNQNPNNLTGLSSNSPTSTSNTLYIQKIDSLTFANNVSPNTTPDDWIQFYYTQGFETPKLMEVNQNGLHLTAKTISTGFDITPNYFPTNYNEIYPTSTNLTNYGWYINLCLDGYLNYSTILSKTSIEITSLAVSDHATYITSRVNGLNLPSGQEPAHPLTHPISNWGGGNEEFSFQKIVFNSSVSVVDSLFPTVQTVCKFATPEALYSTLQGFPSDSLPNLYLEGQTLPQYLGANSFTYQWQIADNPSGPWTDIQGATLNSYLPNVTTYDRYYRRKTFLETCGNTTLYSISTVSSIIIDTLTAPSVDAGGPFHSCPNVSIPIGGTPTALGGTAPYTFVWNQNIDSLANPIYSSSQNAILELTVIDANGCVKKDQAVFNVHSANAGIDKAICDGNPVSIGHPLQGLPGVSYSWSPGNDLSCTTCPSPIASPSSPTQYVFTQTLQLINGTTCSTTDTVDISIVTGPGPNFAGPDTIICESAGITLGLPSQPGFTYQWSPTDGLTNYYNSSTVFYPSNLTYSSINNPITYTLSAQNQNCYFTDDVSITYLFVDAGFDFCDSSSIGFIDNTPNINETYSWTTVNGSPVFTSSTNSSQSSAYTTGGQNSTLELEVYFNGVSCTDQVEIIACSGSSGGGGGNPVTVPPNSCPSNLLSGDTTILEAPISSNVNAVYNWSPQTGLSDYTGQYVELWTNQHQYYYITTVDTITNQIISYDSIEVNNPQWTYPNVSMLDTVICPGEYIYPLNNYNSNYIYYWTGIPSGTGPNPFISPYITTNYYLTVLDTASGCIITDTSTVIVDNHYLYNAAGQDYSTCGNDIIQLGSPEDTNFTYSWSPAIAPWQNGTDQYDAQPYVSLSTTTQFFLTYTSQLANCVYTDSTTITINNQPNAPVIPDEDACIGDFTSINLGVQPGITYSWSPANSVNCSNCYFNVLSPSTTTQYTVTLYYEDKITCPDSSSTSFTINVSDPIVNLTDFTYCNDGTPTSMTNSNPPSGFVQYSWSPSGLFNNPNTISPNANLVNGNYQLTLQVTDALGCTGSDIVNVTSSLTPPNAGPDKEICLNELPVNIGSASNTGVLNWTPATGIANPTSPLTTFTTNTAGTYALALNTTLGNCSQTDTVIVTVNPTPTVPNLIDQMICSNGCVDIGTTAMPGFAYSWSPSIGLTTTNTATTTACVSQSSSYELEITDQLSCSSTGTVNITVNNVAPPAINMAPITACDSDSNVVINYLVSPSAGNYSYNWTPLTLFNNPTAAQQVLPTPSIGNHGITLEVLDQNTGCIGSASTQINVVDCNQIDTCLANIDLIMSSSTFCSGDTLDFQLFSDTLPMNYTWSYNGYSNNGSGVASAATIVYQNNISQVDTINFNIQPELPTCFVEAIDTFFIVYPNLQPNIQANLLYCAGDSSLFYTDNNYSSYNWDGTINSDTSAYFTAQNNPIVIEITDTNNCVYSEEFNIAEHNWQFYYDTLYICMNDSILIHGNYESLNGSYVDTFATALCDSISIITLVTNSNVNVNNSFSTVTICEGDNVQLNLSGATDYYIAGNTITANEILTPDSTSTVVIIGENNNSCSDSLEINIIVNYLNDANLVPPPLSCEYFEGNLSVQSAIGLSNCQWELSDGTTLNTCNPFVQITTLGCHDALFTATDPEGCMVTSSATNFICIEEGPQAAFSINPNSPTSNNSQVEFNSHSTNASQYNWIINQEDFTGEQVVYTFPRIGGESYEICLIAASDLGCKDTSCLTLEIKEDLIVYVPNSFTPDGNEINNKFLAIASALLETFEIQIFNRWGELIFESVNINIGWDGTYKGKICQEGVYTWRIKYKEENNPEPTSMQGHVTLIK